MLTELRVISPYYTNEDFSKILHEFTLSKKLDDYIVKKIDKYNFYIGLNEYRHDDINEFLGCLKTMGASYIINGKMDENYYLSEKYVENLEFDKKVKVLNERKYIPLKRGNYNAMRNPNVTNYYKSVKYSPMGAEKQYKAKKVRDLDYTDTQIKEIIKKKEALDMDRVNAKSLENNVIERLLIYLYRREVTNPHRHSLMNEFTKIFTDDPVKVCGVIVRMKEAAPRAQFFSSMFDKKFEDYFKSGKKYAEDTDLKDGMVKKGTRNLAIKYIKDNVNMEGKKKYAFLLRLKPKEGVNLFGMNKETADKLLRIFDI